MHMSFRQFWFSFCIVFFKVLLVFNHYLSYLLNVLLKTDQSGKLHVIKQVSQSAMFDRAFCMGGVVTYI